MLDLTVIKAIKIFMFNKLIDKYRENEFFRNVIALSWGTFFSQLIPVIATLILTRLFSSEVFGVFFLYSSIFLLLTIISTLRFEMAILLPDTEKDAFHLLVLSIMICLVFSLIILGIVILYHHQISLLFKMKEIEKWLYFIPVSVFFMGSFQSFSFWSNRQKKYKDISKGKINRAFVSNASQVLSGLPSLKAIGLIPGLIAGQISGTMYLFFKNLRRFKNEAKQFAFGNLYRLIKKYKDIPLLNTVINLIGTVSFQLPFYLLAPFFGSSVVGYYGLSNKIIRAPISLISESIGQVTYRECSEMLNNNIGIYERVIKNYFTAFKLAIIPYSILFFTAPQIFKIFGTEWQIAGEYTQILTPYFLVSFVSATHPFVFTLLNKQKIILIYDSLHIVFRFLAIYLGYKIFNDVKIALILFTGVSLVFNLTFIGIVLYISKNSLKYKRYLE